MQLKEDLKSVLHDLIDELDEYEQLKEAYHRLQPVIPEKTVALPKEDQEILKQGTEEIGQNNIKNTELFKNGPVASFTYIALKSFQEQTDALSNSYGAEFQRAFYKKLHNFRERMQSYPELFPVAEGYPEIRQCILSRNMRLYFKEGKDYPLIAAVAYNKS